MATMSWTEKGCWPAGGAACAARAATRASRRATASRTVLIETFLHEVLRDEASALFYRGERTKSIAGWGVPVGREGLDGRHPGLQSRSVPQMHLVSRRGEPRGPYGVQRVENASLIERHVNLAHE